MSTCRHPLPVLGDAPPPDAPGMDRRAFLLKSAQLAALSLLVEACGNGIVGPQFGGSPVPTSDVVLKLSDHPGLASPGGEATVNAGNVPVAVVNVSGSYMAFSLICPHQGGLVGWQGNGFMCPVHGARFAADGHWAGGQPTSGLYQIQTSYDAAAGTVTILGSSAAGAPSSGFTGTGGDGDGGDNENGEGGEGG